MISRVRVGIAALALSAAGLVGIITQEGYSGNAVIPVPGDVPTIGFGTTGGVKMGDTITPPKAVARVLRDVAEYEGALKNCVTVELHQYEYDAYVDFAYNVGPKKFCESTMVAKLNERDYAGACAEFPRWIKGPGNKDCRVRANKCYGLVERREIEQARCEGRIE